MNFDVLIFHTLVNLINPKQIQLQQEKKNLLNNSKAHFALIFKKNTLHIQTSSQH